MHMILAAMALYVRFNGGHTGGEGGYIPRDDCYTRVTLNL